MDNLIKKLEEQLADYKMLHHLYQEEVKCYKEGNYDKITTIDKECQRLNEAINKRGEKVNKKATDILSGKEKADKGVVKRVKELVNEMKTVIEETLKFIDCIKPELVSADDRLRGLITNLGKGKAGLKAYKGFKEKIPKLFEKKM
jgi:predicted nuclease with TOPRIM domain